MKTKRAFRIVLALFVVSAMLACSFVSRVFTGEGGTGEEVGSADQSSAGEGESHEPIVGTWKQIPFQGIGGRSNVFIGGSGVWFGDYYYVGTVSISNAPVQQGEVSGGFTGELPPQPQGPSTGSGVGQPPAGVGQPPGGQQPASSITAAEIWRTRDGTQWAVVGEPGLGDPEYTTFHTMLYKDRLYVFTGMKAALLVSKDGETFSGVDGEWSDGDVRDMLQHHLIGNALFVAGLTAQKGLRAWLSTDGERFHRVGEDLFGDPAIQYTCGYSSPVALGGWYYLGIRNVDKGGEAWRTKDARDWKALGLPNEDPAYTVACVVLDHDGYQYLEYVADYEQDPGQHGVDVFRTADGENWEKVIENGFGLGQVEGASGVFQVYKDRLYFVLMNGFDATATGAKGFRLWQSQDGRTWEQVGEPGFGYAASDQAILYVIRDVFYLVAHNMTDGNQVWRSSDGTNWELFFTFPANRANYGHYLVEIKDGLEYFEYDMANGVQIWRYGP